MFHERRGGFQIRHYSWYSLFRLCLCEQVQMSGETHVRIPEEALAVLCRRYHVRRLALFGSALREDFGPESDVDVLVEFEPVGRTPVDLHTYRSLSRYFRDDVLREAEVKYERKKPMRLSSTKTTRSRRDNEP